MINNKNNNKRIEEEWIFMKKGLQLDYKKGVFLCELGKKKF